MNHIAQGKETVADWDKRMQQIDTLYEKDDILMNFVTNHDENSWNGTVEERMGDGAAAFTALSFVAPGMPLIYSGLEYDMKHRLKFFEKDQIPKTKGDMWALLEKLGTLKNTHVAMHGGKKAASYTKLTTGDSGAVLAFKREKDGKKIYYVGNLSKDAVITTIDLAGSFTNAINGDTILFREGQDVALKPWQYMVLLAE
jgi:glycosidase